MSLPTLVIGDVHGHLDRLEALLKQEGLLDRCDHCDGSGLVYEPAPDDFAHEYEMGKEIDCANCEGDGWCRTNKPAEIVMLGDIGHFGVDGSPTGDMLTWRAARAWADVILWGNHDRAIVAPQHAFGGYSGYDPTVKHIVARARAEGKLKLAHSSHGFLFTHAGLALAFRENNGVPEETKTDPTAFADWINLVEDEDHLTPEVKVQIGVRDAISYRRGGMSGTGGILWRDVNEKLYDGYRQVFGHSADHEEHRVRFCTANQHSRYLDSLPVGEPISYCVDVGGKGGRPGDECLAGIWLPNEEIVRVDL